MSGLDPQDAAVAAALGFVEWRDAVALFRPLDYRVDPFDLRLFAAVLEHGSITAAARACHVTQPSVSMQLRELTDAVGLPLYEVVGKRLPLTPAGETLANTARAMVAEWADFEQRIDAVRTERDVALSREALHGAREARHGAS